MIYLLKIAQNYKELLFYYKILYKTTKIYPNFTIPQALNRLQMQNFLVQEKITAEKTKCLEFTYKSSLIYLSNLSPHVQCIVSS